MRLCGGSGCHRYTSHLIAARTENTDIASPDALTESFCERCGTRYEFAAPTRLSPIRRTRGLVGGFKNYVMGHDSLRDSIGDARRVQAEELAAGQLEAFHSAFNFCLECRQYTCLTCWNHEAGRCQSCIPLSVTVAPLTDAPGIDLLEARLEAAIWPDSDLSAPEPQPEPVIVERKPLPPILPVSEPLPHIPQAEPSQPEPEPVIVEREPLPPILPVSEPVPHVTQVEPSPPDLRVAASAAAELGRRARRLQLDLLGLGQADGEPVASDRPNVLPYRSSIAASHATKTPPGVQNCGTCGLSLSTSARFCRRCGTPQARSA